MKTVYTLFTLLFMLISCTSNSQSITNRPIDDYTPISENNLIDVRTPTEFEQGHLPSAVNIDFASSDFLKGFEKYNKNEPIYIYCRSGRRSALATKQLAKLGFKNIVHLDGGVLLWEELGRQLIK